MKTQETVNTASVSLSSPTGGSSVQVYHDYQRVAFKTRPGNGRTIENDPHPGDSAEKMLNITSTSPDQRFSMRDDSSQRNSSWLMDSSSQACSGPEDNSMDPHETLTETSTLTFVDAHGENHSLHEVAMVYLKEFVLIDDDDDGDMSLREKTVTDLSIMDGKAADLVCGRLFSTSSGSVSECKEELQPGEDPPSEEYEPSDRKQRCCSCTIL